MHVLYYACCVGSSPNRLKKITNVYVYYKYDVGGNGDEETLGSA